MYQVALELKKNIWELKMILIQQYVIFSRI